MYNGITKAQVAEEREYRETHKNNGTVFLKNHRTGEIEHYFIGGETCHRPVYSVGGVFGRDWEAVLLVTRSGRNYRDFNRASYTKAYIDWLVNRSPWADIFLLKDAEQILDDHFYVETKVPNNLMMGGIIAARHSWEFPTNIKFWYELVKAGVDETVAFILIYHFRKSDSGIKVSGWGMHNAIAGFVATKDYYKNFYKGVVYYACPNYSTGKRYQNVDKCWGNTHDTYIDSHWIVNEIISLTSPKDSKGPSDTLLKMNPWYTQMKKMEDILKKRDHTFTFDDLVRFGKVFLNLKEMQ